MKGMCTYRIEKISSYEYQIHNFMQRFAFF